MDAIRVTALGGLGEVGMNCMLIEYRGTRVLLDCGVTFPKGAAGADVAHADFDMLGLGPDALDAILLTHGHEDHVGALPYLLERCPAPVIGPAYALAVARERLAERGQLQNASLRCITPGERVAVGAFEVEPVRVTHSMPDATSLVLRTDAGLVIHSGDFKIDANPTDDEPFDAARFRALGDEGVLLLMSDSTNIDRPQHTRGEAEVAERLKQRVCEANGRAVVALFGSNVHRLRALVGAAEASGRKLCLLGRSLCMHARLASELGHLDGLAKVQIPERQAANHPREQLLLGVTGTQGEGAAALPRLARGEHRSLTLEAGDTVFLSARIIPGCELTVHEMLDGLERLGVEVVTHRDDPALHSSGHAASPEQAELMRLLRPRFFVPVHGTFHHLTRHAQLARSLDVERAEVFENGQPFEVSESGLERLPPVESGRVYRQRGVVLDDGMRRERALMLELGHALVAVALDHQMFPRDVVAVQQRGFLPDDDETAETLSEAAQAVTRELRAGGPCGVGDDCQVRTRRALRRFFRKALGRTPLISVAVIEPSR